MEKVFSECIRDWLAARGKTEIKDADRAELQAYIIKEMKLDFSPEALRTQDRINQALKGMTTQEKLSFYAQEMESSLQFLFLSFQHLRLSLAPGRTLQKLSKLNHS